MNKKERSRKWKEEGEKRKVSNNGRKKERKWEKKKERKEFKHKTIKSQESNSLKCLWRKKYRKKNQGGKKNK